MMKAAAVDAVRRSQVRATACWTRARQLQLPVLRRPQPLWCPARSCTRCLAGIAAVPELAGRRQRHCCACRDEYCWLALTLSRFVRV
jgi:hypothetical protein